MSNKLSLKQLHQIETDVLQVFHDFCEKHNLTYYLFFGTLLGAVRHNGFIPWDDDLDVLMPRHDYEKFIKLFIKDNQIPHIHLATVDTQPSYHVAFAKLHDSRFKAFYDHTLRKPYFLGPWIDIFPLDNMSDNIKTAKYLHRQVVIWSRLLQWRACKTPSFRNPKHILRFLVSSTFCFMPIPFFIRKIDRLSKRYASDTFTKYVFNVSHVFGPSNEMMPSKWFVSRELHSFGGRQFYIPSAWHEILTYLYGDYMTPVKEKGHTDIE